jgi:hypothetical protein
MRGGGGFARVRAVQDDMLYFARAAAELQAAGTIQLFPPGAQEVVVSTKEGKAVPLSLVIDADAAATLEAARAEHQARADANEGDAPFFDFNHEDREAAAWPKRIFWAGDDAREGGIRAEVEWTGAGEAAVQGKTFRRFSPAFHAEGGRITGAPVNMGGLVNRAAFQRIQPLFAKQAADDPKPDETEKTMNTEEQAALVAENTELKAKLQTLGDELQAMKKAEAETLVANAAKEGRIPAAPEFQAKWVASILADPNAKELLASLPAKAPAKTEFTGKQPGVSDADAELVKDAAALLAKYESLGRDERTVFFASHRKELIAARDAKLRGQG